MTRLFLVAFFFFLPSVHFSPAAAAFVYQQQHSLSSLPFQQEQSSSTLAAAAAANKGFGKSGKGFGNKANSGGGGGGGAPPPAKTYGRIAEEPIQDLIDMEAAMNEFFTTREDWLPLFRGMSTDSCAASSFLEDAVAVNDFTEASSSPWRRLQAIPDHPSHKEVLGSFLDSVHQALLDIPVTNSKNGQDDENDLHFLEEGRRMLAISRFHVVGLEDDNEDDSSSSSLRAERYERLFATCWSELMELRSTNQPHTGSLILFPDTELMDVRRFCDMNLQRPLEWLGIRHEFEVASMERGSPAIRLLYKLEAIPDIPEDESAYN